MESFTFGLPQRIKANVDNEPVIASRCVTQNNCGLYFFAASLRRPQRRKIGQGRRPDGRRQFSKRLTSGGKTRVENWQIIAAAKPLRHPKSESSSFSAASLRRRKLRLYSLHFVYNLVRRYGNDLRLRP
jgi:hypothetical protein